LTLALVDRFPLVAPVCASETRCDDPTATSRRGRPRQIARAPVAPPPPKRLSVESEAGVPQRAAKLDRLHGMLRKDQPTVTARCARTLPIPDLHIRSPLGSAKAARREPDLSVCKNDTGEVKQRSARWKPIGGAIRSTPTGLPLAASRAEDDLTLRNDRHERTRLCERWHRASSTGP